MLARYIPTIASSLHGVLGVVQPNPDNRKRVNLDIGSAILTDINPAYLVSDDFDVPQVIEDAWKRYDVARIMTFASGDHTGVRRFLPELFERMLNQAEADAERAEAKRNADAAQAAAEQLKASSDLAELSASYPTVEAVKARIGEIETELQAVDYLPWGIGAAKRRSALADERSRLNKLIVTHPIVGLVSVLAAEVV